MRRRPDASLLIIGAGPERQALLDQARRLNVADRVEVGAIPGELRGEMARVLASAGLVVLLSEYEAHPVALTEARGLGRPVLVADTTGLRELAATGEATAVAIEASGAEVAEAMDHVMRSPPQAAAKVVSWDDCAAQLLEVYRSVLNPPPTYSPAAGGQSEA